MAQRILVNTEDGVTMAMPLDGVRMKRLGSWLCNEVTYHDKVKRVPEGGWKSWDNAEFDEEQQKNGGYCNICRDFAGRLLEVLESE